jgi:uncharacterized membrane protein YfcA
VLFRDTTLKSLIKLMIYAIGAGIISGTVGLSGSIIISPILLEFHVQPMVTSATGISIRNTHKIIKLRAKIFNCIQKYRTMNRKHIIST